MSSFIHIEEILRLILVRLPVATVAEMQLVSREWRRVIHSPSFARELYDAEQPHHQAVLIVTRTEIRAMYVTYLCEGNDNVVVRACIREFPTIGFPVTRLIGSCEGLVCLTDSCHQLFVINPRTLRVRQIMPEAEDNLRAWNYGFGWRLRDTMRCHIVLRLVDGGFTCVKIFDLTTNRWTRRDFNWASKNWRCRVDCEASSAFANGDFLWLGTVTAAAGHSFPSVIIFDAAQETFRHLPLLPEMIGFALRIGNIGDNFIGIWGRDADLTCFWHLNLTIGAFTPVNIEDYPSGIHFQPLCFPGGGRIVMLQQHRHLDLYNHPEQSRNQLHIQTSIPWMLNHFTVEEFCMAIAFSPSLISPGELEDGAHADERERIEAEGLALEEARKKKLEERKRETKQIVVEEIRKDEEIQKSMEQDANIADIDTDDELNEAEEYEAWKAREIARIKRDREEREAMLKDKMDPSCQ